MLHPFQPTGRAAIDSGARAISQPVELDGSLDTDHTGSQLEFKPIDRFHDCFFSVKVSIP